MKLILYFLLLPFIWFYSCKNREGGYGVGMKVIMPAHTQIYYPFGTDTSRSFLTDNHSQFKIYTLINTSCATCIGKLIGWDKFKSENPELSDVPIIPVCFSRDNFELLKFLIESRKISTMHLPLVLDIKDSFATLNRTLVRTGDFTALTDTEDHIVVPGDPLENNNVKNRFLKAVRNAR